MPTHSQAHWQVARATTLPKPAKELALSTHEESEEDKARNANKVSYVMRGKVVSLNISTINKRHSGLIVWSFENPHYAYTRPLPVISRTAVLTLTHYEIESVH